MQVNVVWGPPAAGKSTYVEENRSGNSLTFDFDKIMTVMSGLKLHHKNKNLIGYMLDIRELIIDKLEKEKRFDDAWIIITWVDEKIKEKFVNIEDVNYILMDTDMETCLERVDNDPDRADVVDEMKKVIKEWFEKYEKVYGKRGGGCVREIRAVQTEFEVRQEGEDKQRINGYAALFDSEAPETAGFIEKIAPGAFSNALEKSDTVALFNHNMEKVLGRKTAGTLELIEDEKGLYYEIDPPNTTYANDLIESMNRGDINQSSFGFTVAKEEWDESEEVPVRTIVEIAELIDVSPVTRAWYPQTESGLKSKEEVLQEYRNKQQRANKGALDLYKRKLKTRRKLY